MLANHGSMTVLAMTGSKGNEVKGNHHPFQEKRRIHRAGSAKPRSSGMGRDDQRLAGEFSAEIRRHCSALVCTLSSSPASLAPGLRGYFGAPEALSRFSLRLFFPFAGWRLGLLISIVRGIHICIYTNIQIYRRPLAASRRKRRGSSRRSRCTIWLL
jgi:hypothetical protein